MNIYRLIGILALACFCISGISGYTVTGNKLYDPTGKQVLLRGVDRPSFEWSQTGEQASLADYTLMKGWGANVVRLATNQDFWLQTSTYAATIDQQVSWVTGLGMGIILDLHWNNGGQQNMADRNSITFWSQVAARYKGNAWVMFELYNEPHDVSWSQWLSGDSQYAGMQEMYNAVRAAGASNTVLVGGLNWAFDLSGVGQGYSVQGSNIAYATHPYDYDGKQVANWPAAFGYLAATSPVVMTEFGQYCATDTYVSDLLQYAQSNQIHWTAWAWYVSGCSFPSIISDWNGTPSAGVGELVKSYLSGNAPASSTTGSASTPPPASSGSSITGSSTQAAGSAMAVYTGTLGSGWQDWSWATSYSLSDTTYVQSGSASIKFQVMSYQGIYLHYTSSFALGSYSTLQFYVNGGTNAVSASALSVKIYGSSGSVIGTSVNFPASVPVGQWSLISIPISSFGEPASTACTGFVIQSNVASSAGTIWISNIAFVPAASSAAPTNAPASTPTTAPTTLPTTRPTSAPTAAPTTRPTTAPTTRPTTAPTAAPTTRPTTAPTPAPTSRPTTAPTTRPTTAPTTAPTAAPTAAPTTAPTTRPTTAPTTAPTAAPTARPTPAPTTKPSTTGSTSSSSCDASSVQLSQTVAGSWQSNGQTITQYTLTVSTTCTTKTLVGMTLAASNWNPVSFWNVQSSSTSSANGQTVLSLPTYATVSHATAYSFGYQNAGGEASFTISSVTFQ